MYVYLSIYIYIYVHAVHISTYTSYCVCPQDTYVLGLLIGQYFRFVLQSGAPYRTILCTHRVRPQDTYVWGSWDLDYWEGLAPAVGPLVERPPHDL